MTGAALTGALRLTWVQDDLAHVLEHAGADEPTGTWIGLASADHGLAAGTDVDAAVISRICAAGEIADVVWEAPAELADDHGQAHGAAMLAFQAGEIEKAERLWRDVEAIWSRAWQANCAALEFMQETGLSRLAPVRPHGGARPATRPSVTLGHSVARLTTSAATHKAADGSRPPSPRTTPNGQLSTPNGKRERNHV